MAHVEERVSRLEEALMKLVYAQFNTEMELRQLSTEMRAFKEEMKDFKEEMKDFKEEMRVFKTGIDDFKDEMRGFKDEMRSFKDETQAMIKDMNKKWGELANKMGTVVEDLVAPNIPRIAKQYFGFDELDALAIRLWRRHSTDRSKRREFDVIAVAGNTVILNETKETVRDSDLRKYVEFIRSGDFFLYFPEYVGKRLIPIFSSLAINEDKLRYLSRQGIYAMAITEAAALMDLLNFEECRRPGENEPLALDSTD